MDAKRTGALIAELRAQKGMTQRQLADTLLVSDKAVSRWETGRGMPDIGNIEALADALDVSVAELLHGERIEGSMEAEDVEGIAADGLALVRQLLRKRSVNGILLGFVLGAIVLLLAFVHLTSRIAIPYREGLVRIERMEDGSLLAMLDDNVAGYDLEPVNDPDNEGVDVFLTCYDTRWNQLAHPTGHADGSVLRTHVVIAIGDAGSISAIHYYPGSSEDVLLYGESSSEGVITLPRLVYNYWLIIGIAATAVGFVAYALLRKRWFAGRILRAALLPACFTVSLVLVLWGSFDRVYNASFYLSGICLLAIVLYALCLLVLERRSILEVKAG
ncbi:MAG: helix-turn-helix domain-containing protein [Atopobiaceae bacterium]|nr:helix-turn-helix domain-containing protein [Atopobiaceae bacterium]